MAPRETPKLMTKVQRTVKETTGKGRSSPIGAIKKTIFNKKTTDKPKVNINSVEVKQTRQRMSTVPKVTTPKAKDSKSAPIPSSVTKSAKKPTWKKRPKPAHSGVPVPEKMKKLMEKQFQDPEFVL